MLNMFTPFPKLETERLILRSLEAGDDEAIFAYQSNKENFVHVEMPVYKDIYEARAYIEKMKTGVGDNKWIIWAICDKVSGQMLGSISVWNLDEESNKAELGYGIFPDHRRKGYMKEAITAVVAYGFRTMGLDRIEAYTSHYNQPSIDFLDSMDFDYVETIEDSYSPHGLMDVFVRHRPEYIIRQAEKTDITTLSALIQRVLVQSNSADYSDRVIDFMKDYYSEDSIQEKFESKSTWLLEAYEEAPAHVSVKSSGKDQNLVVRGTISLCGSEIQALFIDRSAQKGGYGKALLNTAEVYAHNTGIEKLHLSASLTAKVFYEKMGYRHVEIQDDEDFGKAYLMEKVLKF